MGSAAWSCQCCRRTISATFDTSTPNGNLKGVGFENNFNTLGPHSHDHTVQNDWEDVDSGSCDTLVDSAARFGDTVKGHLLS